MVQVGYVCITVPRCTEICEDIWQWYDQRHKQLVIPRQKLPDHRYEQDDTSRDETEEEDHNNRMLLVHEIVSQPRPTAGDAAIREEDIEFTERGGDLVDKKAMKEADGRVSEDVSEDFRKARIQYLNAGRRPKKAMKVTREIVMVEMSMARMKDMVEMR